jgi:Mg-chelatase subunit ChlD
MRDYCDITILLDSSGSMQAIVSDMEGALLKVLEEQKQHPGTKVSYYRFHSHDSYDEVFVNKSIGEIDEIKLDPQGMTALVDAWCRTIDKTGERLGNMPEQERPNKVIFIVITDGEENDSREFSESQLKDKIKKQEETYGWNFIYLGANQISKDTATKYGIRNLSRVSDYDASTSGVVRMSAFACSAIGSIRNS